MSLVKCHKVEFLYLSIDVRRDKYNYNPPFKFSQNVSHENSALHSFVHGAIVFKECKHVPAVLHSQTSDQLLHDLITEEEQQCYWANLRMKLALKCSTQTHLSSCGVGVDGDLAGTSSMTVNRGSHFLPGEQRYNFLLRGNKLSGLGLLQGLTYEMGKHFNFSSREQLPDPEKTPGTIKV